MYAAVGLPVEGIGILIAVDLIPDLFKTTLNVTADMAAVTLMAGTSRKMALTIPRTSSPRSMAGLPLRSRWNKRARYLTPKWSRRA